MSVPAYSGSVFKIIEIEGHGHYDEEWFCYYEYKPECEPEVNKVKWPDPKDRWYEGYLTQKQILKAIASGVEFKDADGVFQIHNCVHKWISLEPYTVCEKCGIDIRNA